MIKNGRYCSCVYDDLEKLASKCPWCILEDKSKRLEAENKRLRGDINLYCNEWCQNPRLSVCKDCPLTGLKVLNECK